MNKYLKRYPLIKFDNETLISLDKFMILWNSKLENISVEGESSDFIMLVILGYYAFNRGALIPFIEHIENKLLKIKFDFSYATPPKIIINHNPVFFSQVIPKKTVIINNQLLSKLYYWYIDIWPLRTCGAYYLPSYNILNIKHQFNICEGIPDDYVSIEQMLLHFNGISILCPNYQDLVRNTLIYNDTTLIDEYIDSQVNYERTLILHNSSGSVYLTALKNIKSQIYYNKIWYDLPTQSPFVHDGNKRIIFYLNSCICESLDFINNGLFLGILRMYSKGEIRYADSIIPNSTSIYTEYTFGNNLYTSYKMSPTAQTLGHSIITRSNFLSFAVEKWYKNKKSCIPIEYSHGIQIPLLQPFVDLYWEECKRLIKQKELFITLKPNPPKIFICSTNDLKGYYDPKTHSIYLSDKYHDFNKICNMLTKKEIPSVLFSTNLPIPTLIHELLHSIGCFSHENTNILGSNLSFDDCAHQLYNKMNILSKYFELFKI